MSQQRVGCGVIGHEFGLLGSNKEAGPRKAIYRSAKGMWEQGKGNNGRCWGCWKVRSLGDGCWNEEKVVVCWRKEEWSWVALMVKIDEGSRKKVGSLLKVVGWC